MASTAGKEKSRVKSAENKRKRSELTSEEEMSTDNSSASGQKKKQKTSSSNLNPPPIQPKNEKEEKEFEKSTGDLDLKKLLAALTKKRANMWRELLDSGHWATLMEDRLGSPYDSRLPGEPRGRKLYNDVARHFIRWNIYPHTETLTQFVQQRLTPEAIQILDSVQKFADHYLSAENPQEQDTVFLGLMKYITDNIETISTKLPPRFDRFILSAWSRIESYTNANRKNWAELDWCKGLYSIIDEVMLKSFQTRSNRKTVHDQKKDASKPDFQVSLEINDKDVVLLVGEDDPMEHSAVGHKDTIKLFELLHGICQDAGYDDVAKYGVLNGGPKTTIFRAELIESNIEVDNNNVSIPMYNIYWILDEDEEIEEDEEEAANILTYTNTKGTFTYTFKDFSKLLKTLAALYFSIEHGFEYLATVAEGEKKSESSVKTGVTPLNKSTSHIRVSHILFGRFVDRLAEGMPEGSNKGDKDEDDEGGEEQMEIVDDDFEKPDVKKKDDDEDDETHAPRGRNNNNNNLADKGDGRGNRSQSQQDNKDTQRSTTHGKQQHIDIPVQDLNQSKSNVVKVKYAAHSENNKLFDDIANKDFGHLMPNKTLLLKYAIIEQKENIWYLKNKYKPEEEFIAKWCHSEGRDLPYEVDVLSVLPLKTVLQPIEWASVDNNRYHVMIFDRLYHSKVGALQNFVSSVRGIVASLRYIHKRGFVHGDFKFHNTMYSLARGSFIIDFECTHLLVDAEFGHHSPEQILRGECTHKSEMYSFGIWLIEWFFQQSLHRLLMTYRPDFNDDENEIETGKVLLEIFEEYVDSKSYDELWTTHPVIVEEKAKLSEPCLTIEQFNTFKMMIRELLDEDPEKRPQCSDLITNPKYKPFFGDKPWEPVLIKKELRKVPKSHVIESHLARTQKKKEQKTFSGALTSRSVLRDITNL